MWVMSMFSFFSSSGLSWNVSEFPKPWDIGRIPIYTFIKEHIKPGQPGLPEEANILPDEIVDNENLRWVAGGLEGSDIMHAGANQQKKIAKKIYSAFKKIIKNPTKKHIFVFYKLLLDNSAIDFVDELIPLIGNSRNLDFERVEQFARWLATKSPDRGPVKAAIAILGVFPGEQNKELFVILSRHDEFTIYSAVAFINAFENPELELWELAKNVNGWGRIGVVQRLAGTKNEEIKRWMLREGYKNSIMYEYLAYNCAVTGGLLSALQHSRPDDALLVSAGDIIRALIGGDGPAESMDHYDDGAEVTQLYLHHITDRPIDFEQLLVVKDILDFVKNDEVDWKEREKKGWLQEVKKDIADKANIILNRPEWKEKVISVLRSEVNSDECAPFHVAALVAEAIGIDTWDYYYARQKSEHGDEWYYLMQTKDASRIDKVLRLAEDTIPLEQIATGSEFKYHDALGFIVQDLDRFPGKGWKLIKVSLKSSVIRNRNMALIALSRWGKENWPEDAKNILKEALQNETDADVKGRIQKVIKGKFL